MSLVKIWKYSQFKYIMLKSIVSSYAYIIQVYIKIEKPVQVLEVVLSCFLKDDSLVLTKLLTYIFLWLWSQGKLWCLWITVCSVLLYVSVCNFALLLDSKFYLQYYLSRFTWTTLKQVQILSSLHHIRYPFRSFQPPLLK